MKHINSMKYIAALILFLAQAVIAQNDSTNEVKAPDGTFVGVQTQTGRQFLGVPYAEPPVGELRWSAPKKLSVKPNRFPAQKFGSVCVQPASTGNFTP